MVPILMTHLGDCIDLSWGWTIAMNNQTSAILSRDFASKIEIETIPGPVSDVINLMPLKWICLHPAFPGSQGQFALKAIYLGPCYQEEMLSTFIRPRNMEPRDCLELGTNVYLILVRHLFDMNKLSSLCFTDYLSTRSCKGWRSLNTIWSKIEFLSWNWNLKYSLTCA